MYKFPKEDSRSLRCSHYPFRCPRCGYIPAVGASNRDVKRGLLCRCWDWFEPPVLSGTEEK